MKFLCKRKDGGKESSVTGYWLFEIKWLCSIALLKFDGPSRQMFHSHAFNSISWILNGFLIERRLKDNDYKLAQIFLHESGFKPVVTTREHFHIVNPRRTKPVWVLTFRGPWAKTWQELNPKTNELLTLVNGRMIKDRGYL